MGGLEDRVASVRRFSRFYTRKIGVLHEGLLGSPLSLTEGRVIWELAQRERATASELALCQFPDYPTFGQRQRTAEKPLVQDANLAGVEPAKAPDACDPIFHPAHPDMLWFHSLTQSSILSDKVNFRHRDRSAA